jgi:hypothetical protein
MIKPKTETISFRADIELLQQIDEARGTAMTRGTFTKHAVIAYLRTHRTLQETDFERLFEVVELLSKSVAQVDLNLKQTLFYLLTMDGVLTPDTARKLISDKLSSNE